MGEKGIPKAIPFIGGWSYVSTVAFVVLLLLAGGIVNNYGLLGDFKLPTFSTVGVIPEGAPVSTSPGTTVETAPVSTQLQVTTVDIQTSVRESQADTTGVKNRVGGTVAWYYDSDTTPFETTTLSTTAFASSSTDARPGAKIMGIFTNASYYNVLVANPDGSAIDVPLSPSMSVTAYADLLNAAVINCQNSTAGIWQSAIANQTLTTDEATTLSCKLVGAAARGVFKGPIKICFDYNTANLSSSGTYVVGATKGTVPSGVAAGYESCWDTTLADVTDFNEVPFQVRITPISGVDPGPTGMNLTIKAIDCGGTYTKAVWPDLFTGCENPDTLAAVGSTDDTFVVGVS